MQHDSDRRSDLWSGLFWIVLGLAIVVHSAGMPVPRNLGATTLTGPGFLPMILGGMLALLGVVLMIRARRASGADAQTSPAPADQVPSGVVQANAPEPDPAPEETSNMRAAIALMLMVAYAASLALRQPFIPCTTLFVTVFVTVFNWQDRNTGKRLSTIIGALLLAGATAIAIEFIFEQIFFVRLP
ncbi:tripartite tricarboxylate transporter TctB family protein [Paracoccus beibuensis]|uniref:tripartite tricarboxylate transporter TctB family protein n=1 Tax=Paracoccus beibuensis TaxID=547602 RepID=UPI0022400FB1|nr:tripartite tricarboxylate transporter TctB family protein [Paracoccus beibuensis]